MKLGKITDNRNRKINNFKMKIIRNTYIIIKNLRIMSYLIIECDICCRISVSGKVCCGIKMCVRCSVKLNYYCSICEKQQLNKIWDCNNIKCNNKVSLLSGELCWGCERILSCNYCLYSHEPPLCSIECYSKFWKNYFKKLVMKEFEELFICILIK